MTTPKQQERASEKNLEMMRSFAEAYAKRTGTYFCSDLHVTATVIEGLAQHKDKYGSPLCPCRHYEDKAAEVEATFWNCPCVPMRERRECHCLLFLNSESYLAGETQEISLEQVLSVRDTIPQ